LHVGRMVKITPFSGKGMLITQSSGGGRKPENMIKEDRPKGKKPASRGGRGGKASLIQRKEKGGAFSRPRGIESKQTKKVKKEGDDVGEFRRKKGIEKLFRALGSYNSRKKEGLQRFREPEGCKRGGKRYSTGVGRSNSFARKPL